MKFLKVLFNGLSIFFGFSPSQHYAKMNLDQFDDLRKKDNPRESQDHNTPPSL